MAVNKNYWELALPLVLLGLWTVLREDFNVIYCDASATAYGAVAYLANNEEKLLLLAKNYLSNKTTIPELEFMALMVGIRVMEIVKPIFPDHKIVLFTDSKITKERFLKNPNKLKPSLGIQILQTNKYKFSRNNLRNTDCGTIWFNWKLWIK